jgi:hypothetical protein
MSRKDGLGSVFLLATQHQANLSSVGHVCTCLLMDVYMDLVVPASIPAFLRMPLCGICLYVCVLYVCSVSSMIRLHVPNPFISTFSWGVAFVALSVLCMPVSAMHSWLCTAPPM